MNNIELYLTFWCKSPFIHIYAKFDFTGKLIMYMYLYVIDWLIVCCLAARGKYLCLVKKKIR
jgi:hypothetical protein